MDSGGQVVDETGFRRDDNILHPNYTEDPDYFEDRFDPDIGSHQMPFILFGRVGDTVQMNVYSQTWMTSAEMGNGQHSFEITAEVFEQ
jgi:hypothetical protein